MNRKSVSLVTILAYIHDVQYLVQVQSAQGQDKAFDLIADDN